MYQHVIHFQHGIPMYTYKKVHFRTNIHKTEKHNYTCMYTTRATYKGPRCNLKDFLQYLYVFRDAQAQTGRFVTALAVCASGRWTSGVSTYIS